MIRVTLGCYGYDCLLFTLWVVVGVAAVAIFVVGLTWGLGLRYCLTWL